MSLLIKALEKAEQGKGAEAKKPPVPADGLSLESVPLSFEADGDDFGKGAAASSGADQQRQAATLRHAQRHPHAVSKGTWLVAGAGAALAILLGLGLYLYLQSLSEPELIVAHNEPPPQVQTAPAPPAAVVAGAPGLAASSQAEAAGPQEQPPPEKDTPQAVPAVSLFQDRQKPAATPPATHSRPAAEKARVFGEPVESSPDTSVKITRNKPVSGVSPALAQAYQALLAGDDAMAERNYRAVLQGDARNVDAMLGMATLASRQGKIQEAQRWYGQVLEIEPRNSTAQAALIALGNQADPVGSETRLKNLLAQHPDAAYLYAALGDLYSSQNMWPAAQQAYFQAHHYQPNEPHYLFNLAVSLDQMAKPALALQYYQQTLGLLDTERVPDIDRAQIEARIAQLQQ